MCGRYALTAPTSQILETFELSAPGALASAEPRYNIAPTTEIPGVLVEDDTRVVRAVRWGLVPPWAKDKKAAYNTINARKETLAESKIYRKPFEQRRMLVIASGFYEWAGEGKSKIPHLIEMADGGPFGMAAVWERWTDPKDGVSILSCAVITTPPNELMAPIHDRMPAILPREHFSRWLDPNHHDTEALTEMLVPYPAASMRARKVSQRVGNVRNQDAGVQGPWEGDAT